MANDPIVRCANVTKRWRGAGGDAVADISLEIPRRALLGIFGPTGSGKSTLLRLIAGMAAPDSGTIIVNGINVAQNEPAIQTFTSYLAQEPDAPDTLTISELLYFTGALRGMTGKEARSASRDLLDRAGLTTVARRSLQALPRAQQQMARVCATMMGYPHLLVLDDPMRDLDLTQRNWLWTLLRQLHAETAMTIILVTRDLAEAERSVTHVAFMRGGQLGAVGTPTTLKEQFGAGPHMDMQLKPAMRLTEEMRRRLRALGQLVEHPLNALTLYPKPDVIGTLAQPVTPARARVRSRQATATPSTPITTHDDSWLLDRQVLPGSLGRTVEEIFTIIGAEQITEFWFAPPTLEDAYQRLEGAST